MLILPTRPHTRALIQTHVLFCFFHVNHTEIFPHLLRVTRTHACPGERTAERLKVMEGFIYSCCLAEEKEKKRNSVIFGSQILFKSSSQDTHSWEEYFRGLKEIIQFII